MDILLPDSLTQNVAVFLRQAGYAVASDYNSSELSFKRHIQRSPYPRFHIYLKTRDNQQLISLHLDQKKPSYAGAHAHNGEYDGSVVEAEAQRLQGLIKNKLDNTNPTV